MKYRDNNSENKNGIREENNIHIQLCQWEGQWSDLSTHINQCDLQIIKCGNEGCNDKIIRKEQQEHDKVCEWYKIECSLKCGMLFTALWSLMDKISHFILNMNDKD